MLKKMRKVNRMVGGLLAGMLVVATSVAQAGSLQVQPGSIDGEVVNAAGAAMDGVQLTVTDANGKTIVDVTSGQEGEFNMALADKGQYGLALDGQEVGELVIDDAAKLTSLKIVLPENYEAGAILAGLSPLMLGGAVAAAALTTAVAVDAIDDDDDSTSPSGDEHIAHPDENYFE